MGHERISKDMYYLSIAESVSKRSTCLRKRWGAVIVANDQILSTGYNGAPRGRTNCVDTGYCYRIKHNIPRGTCYETCLFGDTPLLTKNGSNITIGQLSRSPIVNTPMMFSVKTNSMGAGHDIYNVHAITARKDDIRVPCVRVTLENGFSFRCTEDHEILMSDYCTYKHASDIIPGEKLAGVHICKADMDIRYIDEYRQHIVTVVRVDRVVEIPNYVYDLIVPGDENYAVQIGPNLGIFVHNCRSVHAEANAIISASRSEMIGSTMYMYGFDCEANDTVSNPDCCSMCKRLVINAGIHKVIYADANGIHKADHPDQKYGYRVQYVSEWVNEMDDITEEHMSY